MKLLNVRKILVIRRTLKILAICGKKDKLETAPFEVPLERKIMSRIEAETTTKSNVFQEERK